MVRPPPGPTTPRVPAAPLRTRPWRAWGCDARACLARTLPGPAPKGLAEKGCGVGASYGGILERALPPVGKPRLEAPSPTTSARLVCLHGSRFPSGEGTGESSLARAAPRPPNAWGTGDTGASRDAQRRVSEGLGAHRPAAVVPAILPTGRGGGHSARQEAGSHSSHGCLLSTGDTAAGKTGQCVPGGPSR